MPDQHTTTTISQVGLSLNATILKNFNAFFEDPDIKRSHLFNGRYENIYLNESYIPELKPLLEEACAHAEKILGTNNLKAGCWFNHMPPESVTLPHSHDDNDELLSAAYYVSVPQNSGDLIIRSDQNRHRITPEEGMFIFFKPDVVHEVTRNNSNNNRLSIGINFGKKHG